MEPITFSMLFIAALALNVEQQKQDITELKNEIAQIEQMMYNMAGSHAAVSARSQVNDQAHTEQLDGLQKQIDYLNTKINILHP